MKEYDVVRLKRDLPVNGLRAFAQGTILIVHEVPNARRAFEVEFLDDQGQTIALITLEEADVELVWSAPEGQT